MFFKLAVKSIVKNKALFIFMTLQLCILAVIITIVVNAVNNRLKLYYPIKDMISGNGYICTGAFGDEVTEEINDKLTGVDDIHPVALNFLFDPNDESMSFDTYIYDEYTTGLFTPDLSNGKWLDKEISCPEGTVPIVVSDNQYGIGQGDTFRMCFYGNSDSVIEIKFYVCGVLNEGSNYLCPNPNAFLSKTSSDFIYERFFFDRTKQLLQQGYTYEEIDALYHDEQELNAQQDSLLKDMGINIANTSELKFHQPIAFINNDYIQDYDIWRSYCMVLVNCDDSISDKQFYDNYVSLKNSIGSFDYVETYKQLDDNFQNNIRLQITPSLPIIIIIFILIVLCSVSTGAITTIKQMRAFGILYINGSTWYKCIKVNIYYSLMISVLSLLTAFVSIKVFNLTEYAEYNQISFGISELITVFLVLALFDLVSVIIPACILKKGNIKGLLNSN